MQFDGKDNIRTTQYATTLKVVLPLEIIYYRGGKLNSLVLRVFVNIMDIVIFFLMDIVEAKKYNIGIK